MTRDASPALSRYDLLLAVIALPLVLTGLAGAFLSVPLAWALGVGSVPATGGVGYALFYRPPRPT